MARKTNTCNYLNLKFINNSLDIQKFYIWDKKNIYLQLAKSQIYIEFYILFVEINIYHYSNLTYIINILNKYSDLRYILNFIFYFKK